MITKMFEKLLLTEGPLHWWPVWADPQPDLMMSVSNKPLQALTYISYSFHTQRQLTPIMMCNKLHTCRNMQMCVNASRKGQINKKCLLQHILEYIGILEDGWLSLHHLLKGHEILFGWLTIRHRNVAHGINKLCKMPNCWDWKYLLSFPTEGTSC